MPYMAVVITGNAADIHFDMFVIKRFQFGFITGAGIVYANGHG
jgi:hypothetical protein